jgi:hypothetical protein
VNNQNKYGNTISQKICEEEQANSLYRHHYEGYDGTPIDVIPSNENDIPQS